MLDKVLELRYNASSHGMMGDFLGATEIAGTALLADVMLNTHVTQVTMGNQDRLIGVWLIVGAEIIRKSFKGFQQKHSQIANNLAAQLILDELKEKEGKK